MKLNKYGLLSLLLMLAACSEEITQPNNNTSYNKEDDIPTTGVEVHFSAGAEQPVTDATSAKLLASITLEGNATTRVSYTDPADTQGRSLQVRWNAGDQVSVVQVGEKADGTVLLNSDGTLASYLLKSDPLNDTYPTKSNLTAIYDTKETNYTKRIMKWYQDADKSRFFAVYPPIDPNATDGGIKMVYPYLQGGKLDQNKLAKVVVSVPKVQQAESNVLTGDYRVCVPNKNHIYLFAMSSTVAATDRTNYGSIGFDNAGQPATNRPRVALNFKPIMTTLTVGVPGFSNDKATLKEVRVHLKNKNGDIIPFPDEVTINYTKFNYTQNGTTKSMENLCEVDESKNVYKEGKTPYIVAKEGADTQIDQGKTAVFTIMLPPLPYDKDHYKLYVEPIYTEDTNGSNAVTLGTETTKIIPSSKIAFKTKILSKFVLDPANWMGQLKGTTLLKDLSIPGAHNATQVTLTSKGTNWDEPFRQAKQMANITQMLDAGVRAIEIRPNRYTTWETTTVSYYGGVEGEFYSVVNRDNPRHWVLDDIKTWLATHKTECVLILVNRERSDGSASAGPDAVQTIIESYGGNPWDPNLTINDATNNGTTGGMLFFIMKDGDENNEWGNKHKGTTNTYVQGIGYMNIHGDNWWEYERHIGEFKTQNYYGYNAPGAVDGVNTAYEKFNISFAANPYDGTKTATGYFLRHDIGGSLDNASRAKPTFIAKVPGDGFGQATTSKQYTGEGINDNLNFAKEAMTIDFLRMASDPAQASNWFFTYIPVYSYYGSRLDDDKAAQFRSSRSWAALFPLTHKPTLDFVKRYPDKRYGVLFYDFVPGSGYEYSDFRNKPADFSNQISQELTTLLIMSNVKRGLAKGAQ